ncbi:hypothetical protein [Marinovum algicola]|uniref:hypothetical protein n=1 Tax=Marinovum algicola TaxID=42444 RepID=UPI00352AF0BA
MTRVGKLIVSAVVAAALLWGHVAAAQSVCLPSDRMAKQLSDEFDEELIGVGLQNSRRLIQVWRSIEGGSFTIIVARPDGISCVIATGLAWVDVASDADDAEGI